MKLLLILSVLHLGIICLLTCGYTNVQVNGPDVRSTSDHVNISTIHFINTKPKHTNLGQ